VPDERHALLCGVAADPLMADLHRDRRQPFPAQHSDGFKSQGLTQDSTRNPVYARRATPQGKKSEFDNPAVRLRGHAG